jgi:hypothetical protein
VPQQQNRLPTPPNQKGDELQRWDEEILNRTKTPPHTKLRKQTRQLRTARETRAAGNQARGQSRAGGANRPLEKESLARRASSCGRNDARRQRQRKTEAADARGENSKGARRSLARCRPDPTNERADLRTEPYARAAKPRRQNQFGPASSYRSRAGFSGQKNTSPALQLTTKTEAWAKPFCHWLVRTRKVPRTGNHREDTSRKSERLEIWWRPKKPRTKPQIMRRRERKRAALLRNGCSDWERRTEHMKQRTNRETPGAALNNRDRLESDSRPRREKQAASQAQTNLTLSPHNYFRTHKTVMKQDWKTRYFCSVKG